MLRVCLETCKIMPGVVVCLILRQKETCNNVHHAVRFTLLRRRNRGQKEVEK
jgi:hypothetical protein